MSNTSAGASICVHCDERRLWPSRLPMNSGSFDTPSHSRRTQGSTESRLTELGVRFAITGGRSTILFARVLPDPRLTQVWRRVVSPPDRLDALSYRPPQLHAILMCTVTRASQCRDQARPQSGRASSRIRPSPSRAGDGAAYVPLPRGALLPIISSHPPESNKDNYTDHATSLGLVRGRANALPVTSDWLFRPADGGPAIKALPS